MKPIVSSILMLLLMISCGAQGPKSQTKFVISLSSLTAGSYTYDKAFVRVTNTVTGVSMDFPMSDSNIVEIPKGTWQMYFVGFHSTTPYMRCGNLSSVPLTEDDQTVNITVDTVCSPAVYNPVIASAGGFWDASTWDGATFGP